MTLVYKTQHNNNTNRKNMVNLRINYLVGHWSARWLRVVSTPVFIEEEASIEYLTHCLTRQHWQHTWPPRAIMFTHSVLAGRDECSRHDRISVLYAYFESFWSNTYTVKHTYDTWWCTVSPVYMLEACTGTEITPIPTRPHPVSLPSAPIPAELPFHPHPSAQEFVSIPIPSPLSQQCTEYGLRCN